MDQSELDHLQRFIDASFAALDDQMALNSRDGIAWYDAPLPSRWHRCSTQTSAILQSGTFVRRCACGASSYDRGRWTDRNSRHKDKS